MAPLKTTKVIPDQWVEHHRPVAEGTMTALCDVRNPAGKPPVDAPDDWDGTMPLHLNVPCRVQELRQPREGVQADQPQNVRRYLVTLPINKVDGIRAGENGSIVTNFRPQNSSQAFDPMLRDRILRVEDIQHGSLMWERDIVCADNLTQNNPGR